jgi:hypothetical protein
MFQTDGAGATNPSSAAVGSSHSRGCCCNTKMTMSFDNMASSSDRRLLKVSHFTCRPSSERRCQSAANITSKLLLLSYWTAAVAVLLLSATPALAVAKGNKNNNQKTCAVPPPLSYILSFIICFRNVKSLSFDIFPITKWLDNIGSYIFFTPI